MFIQFVQLLFLITSISVPSLPFCSSARITSYSEHCDIPEATATIVPYPTSAFYIKNGYFTGGDEFFPEDVKGFSFPLRSFIFRSILASYTETPGTIKLEAELLIEGDSIRNINSSAIIRITRRPTTEFNVSGLWSATSGKLCMVGYGNFRSEEGNYLELSAVLKLIYPKISNISTSIVSGKLESLDADGSSNHFGAISLLAYAHMSYEFRLLPMIKNSFPNSSLQEESIGLDANGFCYFANNFMVLRYKLEYQRNNCSNRKCGGPLSEELGFSPSLTFLNSLSCRQDGEISAYLSFSNPSEFDFINTLNPTRTLVAEGFWDEERSRLFLAACPVVHARDHSLQKYAVGDCLIRLSFWFPAVISIRRRSTIVGRIWSKRNRNDPRYFNVAHFREDSRSVIAGPGLRYEYSVIDKVHKLCAVANDGVNLGERRYPDGNSIREIDYATHLKNIKGESISLYLTPLTSGSKFLSTFSITNSESETAPTSAGMSQSIWNVSYTISYQSAFSSSDEPATVISAEGIYNNESGMLCMLGCLDSISSHSNGTELERSADDMMDCDILVSIQIPPLHAREGEMSNGSIRSTREKSDPLHFEPLEIFPHLIFVRQGIEMKDNIDTDAVVVLFFLFLVIISMEWRFFCYRRHRNICSI